MRKVNGGYAVLGIAAIITFAISPRAFAAREAIPLKHDVPPPAVADPGERNPHSPEDLARIFALSGDGGSTPHFAPPSDAESQAGRQDYEAMRAIQGASDPNATLPFKIDETLIGQKAVNEALIAAEPPNAEQPNVPALTPTLPPFPAPIEPAKVAGIVTAGDTGLPVSNVYVGIYNASRVLIDSDVTDRVGAYRLTSYYSTTLYARVNPTGVYPYYFMPEWHDNKPAFSSATPISPSPGTGASVNFVLDRGAQISGTVTAADGGAPLEGVRVYVIDSEGYAVDYSATDAAGQYTTGGLQSGGYRLYFQTSLASDAAREYVAEYFNDKSSLTSADLVTVTAPSILTSVNVSLTRGAQISGLVSTEDTGAPLGGVEVMLLSVSTPVVLASKTTDASGGYAFKGLADGGYKVYFGSGSLGEERYYGEYYNDKTSFTRADIINMTAPNVSGSVNAQLGRAGQITGRVVAEDTSQPISRTFVYATPLYDPFSPFGYYGSSTDENGRYSIAAPAGSYRIRFNGLFNFSQSFCGEYYDDKNTAVSANLVEVQSSHEISNINAALTQAGQITGVVTAADTGAPLQGVLVSSGFDDFYGPLYSAFTDVNGRYALQSLCTDSYVVAFTPSLTDSAKYAHEYYNDKTTPLSANPVQVVAPRITGNINAALDRAGAVNGVITAADTSAPLARVFVLALGSEGGLADYSQTNSLGNYTLRSLRPGDYKLLFDPRFGGDATRDYLLEFYNDKASFAEADPVSVTGAHTSTVNASLTLGGKITGTVTFADAGPSYPAEVYLLSASGKVLDYTYADSIRPYQFVVGTGSYVVLVRPTGGTYAFEYYNDKASLLAADVVTVVAPNTVNNINFVLDQGGLIAGRVVNSVDGSGVYNAFVEIFDSTNEQWPIGNASTNASGYYTSTVGLPTGSFKVRVSRPLYLPQFYGGKPTFLEGQVVTVTAPNTTSNVDVSLVPVSALPVQMYFPFANR